MKLAEGAIFLGIHDVRYIKLIKVANIESLWNTYISPGAVLHISLPRTCDLSWEWNMRCDSHPTSLPGCLSRLARTTSRVLSTKWDVDPLGSRANPDIR